MGKEMTDVEIAELNKEFDANAFTQWKFMQTPEYQKLPLAVRCTIERVLFILFQYYYRRYV